MDRVCQRVDSDSYELKRIQAMIQHARQVHGLNVYFAPHVYQYVSSEDSYPSANELVDRAQSFSRMRLKVLEKMDVRVGECLKSGRMTMRAYKIANERKYGDIVEDGEITKAYLKALNDVSGGHVGMDVAYPITEVEMNDDEKKVPDLNEMNEILALSPRGKQLEVDDFSMLHRAKDLTKLLYRQFKVNHENAARVKQVLPKWHPDYDSIAAIVEATPIICQALQEDYTIFVNALTSERKLSLPVLKRLGKILVVGGFNSNQVLAKEQQEQIEQVARKLPKAIDLLPSVDSRSTSEKHGIPTLPMEKIDETRPIGRDTLYFQSPRGKEEGQSGAFYWRVSNTKRSPERYKAMELEEVVHRCNVLIEEAERLLQRFSIMSPVYERLYFIKDDAYFLREKVLTFRKALKAAVIDDIDTSMSKKALRYKIDTKSLLRDEAFIRDTQTLIQ